MLQTPGKPEYYGGSIPNISPTNQKSGVFSFCSGGVPNHGGFQRLPGKTLSNSGVISGGIISIAQMGTLIVVQCYAGLLLFQLSDLLPTLTNYVYDNEGNQVFNNENLPVTTP